MRLNNSKLTGGVLERDRSRDLLAVCSHMLAVILDVCLSPGMISRCCVCIPQPQCQFYPKEMPLCLVSGRRSVTSSVCPFGAIPLRLNIHVRPREASIRPQAPTTGPGLTRCTLDHFHIYFGASCSVSEAFRVFETGPVMTPGPEPAVVPAKGCGGLPPSVPADLEDASSHYSEIRKIIVCADVVPERRTGVSSLDLRS